MNTNQTPYLIHGEGSSGNKISTLCTTEITVSYTGTDGKNRTDVFRDSYVKRVENGITHNVGDRGTIEYASEKADRFIWQKREQGVSTFTITYTGDYLKAVRIRKDIEVIFHADGQCRSGSALIEVKQSVNCDSAGKSYPESEQIFLRASKKHLEEWNESLKALLTDMETRCCKTVFCEADRLFKGGELIVYSGYSHNEMARLECEAIANKGCLAERENNESRKHIGGLIQTSKVRALINSLDYVLTQV